MADSDKLSEQRVRMVEKARIMRKKTTSIRGWLTKVINIQNLINLI